jgi:hypothetical protein
MLHMNLNPVEYVSRYPLHNEFVNGIRNTHKYCILPNLRKIKGAIYFIPKNPIKIFINGKKKFTDKIELKNLSLEGYVYCDDTKILAKILNDELENGLKIKIEYKDSNFIDNKDIKRFAREVESAILNVNITKGNEIKNDIKYKDEIYRLCEEKLEKMYEYDYIGKYNETEEDSDFLVNNLSDNFINGSFEEDIENYSDEDDF